MRTVKCPACGGKTKRNGKTKAGAQRWRCTSCGASTTQRYSNKASMLALFLDWLLSKRTQAQMGMPARTFRSLTSEFWSLWPTAPLCDEVHHVVHVDGIWLKRSCVILIACTEGHVVGWHLARSESSQAWAALMARIAPPDVVVADGGGFERARRAVWPETKVQRCTFHVFEQVKRCTTTRPRTQDGVDLYAMAKGLLKVKTPDAAAEWLGTPNGAPTTRGSSKSARSWTAGRATSTRGCGKRGAASPSCAGTGSCSPTSTKRSSPAAPSPRPTTA